MVQLDNESMFDKIITAIYTIHTIRITFLKIVIVTTTQQKTSKYAINKEDETKVINHF